MAEDWIERASRRLLVPIRIEVQRRKERDGHGAQKALAEEMGVSSTSMSKWLTGARVRMDIDTIQAVAEFFDVEPGYLFDPNVDEEDWKKYADARLEPNLSPEEMSGVLTMLGATAEERKALDSQMKTFRSHRWTASMVEAFIRGLRVSGAKR
jgi:transcriptional regulator with XRE-family HTH domain